MNVSKIIIKLNIFKYIRIFFFFFSKFPMNNEIIFRGEKTSISSKLAISTIIISLRHNYSDNGEILFRGHESFSHGRRSLV